jgi:MFS family permease
VGAARRRRRLAPFPFAGAGVQLAGNQVEEQLMQIFAGYSDEFRQHRHVQAAVMIGLAGGLGINFFIAGLFIPHMRAEFGWSASEVALAGLSSLLMAAVVPIAGRLVDTFGPRRVALVGVATLPLSYLLMSFQTGDIRVFWLLDGMLVGLGITTTSTVYAKFIVGRFNRARGFALGLAIATPPLLGVVAVPLLTDFIQAEGWRAGYRLVAAWVLLCGVAALLMLPRDAQRSRTATASPHRVVRSDYRTIAMTPALWIVIGGMLLCNLPSALGSAQLKPMLMYHGLDLDTAAQMISVYAFGIFAGRLGCGIALDRFPAHIVSFIWMGLPAIGFTLIVMFGAVEPAILIVSMLLIGLSQGAEGDIAAYLASRYFGYGNFSSVLGIVVAILGISSAAGSVILAWVLAETDSFGPALIYSVIAVSVGAFVFLLLGSAAGRRGELTS